MSKRERADAPGERAPPKAAEAAPERRARDRVRNGQGSGIGASSALSKLKMIERHRAQFKPVPLALGSDET